MCFTAVNCVFPSDTPPSTTSRGAHSRQLTFPRLLLIVLYTFSPCSFTVNVSSDANEYFCIPVEMAEKQGDMFRLLPREFFFVNISSVFTNGDMLQVEFEGRENLLSLPCVDKTNGIVRFSINKTVVMSLENQQLYLIIGRDRRKIRIQFCKSCFLVTKIRFSRLIFLPPSLSPLF